VLQLEPIKGVMTEMKRRIFFLPPDLWSADTLYFAYNDGVGIASLLQRFPNHSVYVYRYPGSLTPWNG
jgi:hypothetical protein